MRKIFWGWYFKCQSKTHTLAVIAAVHGGESSVQLITDDGAWNFTNNLEKSFFGKNGLRLELHSDNISAVGELKFTELTPIKYDIMGPFKYLPFMECRHSVVSMCHRVDGKISINGTELNFDNALGYIEGDSGRSFPNEYAWTQCFFEEGSLMLSVADIPFAGLHFTGIIAVILLHGRQYRLATYLGAKAVKISDGEIVIRQGKYSFSAKLIEKHAHPLNAPQNGSMLRTIHESASCRAFYRFKENGRILLELETDRASFEYEYGGNK